MVTGGINAIGDSETAYNDTRRWAGVAGVKGPTWAKMPLLTVTMLGMQIVWSVEMGYGGPSWGRYASCLAADSFIPTASPYLLSLGLSKVSTHPLF